MKSSIAAALANVTKLLAFDSSALSRSKSDLDEMDVEERREAAIEDVNRAIDLLEAIAAAYEGTLFPEEQTLLKTAARSLQKMTRD
jgi:glutamine synthetase type III